MKITDKMSDAFAVFQAIAWIGTVASCMLGFAWWWMFVVGLMVLAMILNGARRQGYISKKLLLYPIIPWFATYMISMAGMLYYHLHYLDSPPDFYILGQHPSAFYMHIFYWIFGILTISVGLAVNRFEWCSEQDWDTFTAQIKEEKEGKANDQ